MWPNNFYMIEKEIFFYFIEFVGGENLERMYLKVLKTCFGRFALNTSLWSLSNVIRFDLDLKSLLGGGEYVATMSKSALPM